MRMGGRAGGRAGNLSGLRVAGVGLCVGTSFNRLGLRGQEWGGQDAVEELKRAWGVTADGVNAAFRWRAATAAPGICIGPSIYTSMYHRRLFGKGCDGRRRQAARHDAEDTDYMDRTRTIIV